MNLLCEIESQHGEVPVSNLLRFIPSFNSYFSHYRRWQVKGD